MRPTFSWLGQEAEIKAGKNDLPAWTGRKVAETVTDQQSWHQIHLSTLPRTGKASSGVQGPVQGAAPQEKHRPNRRSPQNSKENNWRVSRAGLFEERLKGTGITLQKRGTQEGERNFQAQHSRT